MVHTKMEAKLDNLERGFENLLEMMENINWNLQQKGNSTNPSGDSGNGADGNLGEGAGSIEDRWRRLEIPLFSGDDVYGWVSRVERYFNLKGILEQERLQAVMVAMEGKALSWFRWWGFCNSNPSWEDFKAAVISKFQPEFDLDIWVQEEGSESWEQEYRGKNKALKFKNQVGREEAIHKEVEQVKETNIKIVVAEKEMETELELHVGTVVEVQEADIANEIEGQESDADLGNRNVVLFQNKRKWDAVKENNFLGLMGQTQLIQVVYLRTKIPTTRAKSPKLGRRKSLTHSEPEGNTSSNAQQGRLSLDEKVTPNNPTKGISPVHQKKPQRKSLPPRLTSERTSSSNSATARTSSKAVNEEKTSLSSVTTEVTTLSNVTGEEKVEMAAATEENNALSVETIEALRLNIEAGEAQSHVNGDLVIEEKPQITLVQEPITAGH
ncbi:hypothetical protein SESBI_17769 [Sesbania bispinosa]|nr:hypothetical protein SESBI_17769 [Sesbania bispinosa]